MRRVLVLVEGQTEETFVGRVLQPHLWGHEVDITPTVLVTRRVPGGRDFKGGVTSWTKIERDLRRLLGDTGAAAVTTLLDYFGLPGDVPGMATRPSGGASERVKHVEAAIDSAVGGRLKAFLLLHEFEALLYADPALCGAYVGSGALARAMEVSVRECGGPELVDDSPTGAPSKRIRAAWPPFQKTLHGPTIAERIGLGAIRQGCPHFDRWVRWLESLT
jgi:hypothetical protein